MRVFVLYRGMEHINIDWLPSMRHFRFIRNVPYVKNMADCHYWIHAIGDCVYIVFKETDGTSDDWAYNLDFFPRTFDIFPGSKIKAHNALARKYLSVRQEIMDLLYSGKYNFFRVAGFSQGGALATACVQDIGYHIDRDEELKDKDVRGVVYSPPRMFTLNKSKLIKKSVDGRLITVRAKWDPVHHVPGTIMPTIFSFRWKPFELKLRPPTISFWRHYGKQIWIGNWWRVLPVLAHKPENIAKNLYRKFKV